MDLDFLAESAVFIKAKFAFAFCVHINLIAGCTVILVFADGTNQSNYFAGTLFSHIGILPRSQA